ncbi:nuclear transport factor 2 family protein [Novosphingobium aquimarinum]|uniref:nuclear transport factor 2 family protein n=1 Tax=Novosphingobium aquimarinum TaxID=2682494 RepID=UPI0012EB791F|nr:nuclear transport factor 2 family protein [Novosphingobium aquimarinum]
MNRRERAIATAELEMGLADFWHDVDTNWGRRAGEYYAPEGVYRSGKLNLEGREAIEGFYSWREDRGERVAVHAFSNFRAEFGDDGTATANWYMLLWAEDGAAPRESSAPTRISRATERFRWDEEEMRWLCTERLLENLYKGGAQLNFSS